MDNLIEQTWWLKNKKLILIVSFFLSITTLILWFSFSNNQSIINTEKLRIGTVNYGEFQEIILANGTVEPKKTILIDANEGGTIKQINVEEGKIVTAGEVLLVLTNESLILDYMQRETQIVEQINNLRNTRINLHQNLRTTEDQLGEYNKQYTIAKNQYHIDSALASSNGLAKKIAKESFINFNFLQKKVSKLKKRKNDDKQYHNEQIKRIDHSITLMERNLELIRSKLNEINIKAPISGQLNSFNLETGQVLHQNQTVGRIDVPNQYWIKALVSQHYLSRIAEGQGAYIEYEDKTYRLNVSKVQSTVENGQIEIYLKFTQDVSSELRRGQNFQVFVEISAKNKAFMVPKGSFFQSSGGQFVFTISEDGKTAHKKSVQLGRQNPNFYEVISGLDEGDEVIISSYDSFKNEEDIKLTTDK